jgi:hypothetical protein
MQKFTVRHIASSLCLVAVLALAYPHPASSQQQTNVNVLYHTGFESPDRFSSPEDETAILFERGTVAGQNGFTAYGDNSIEAAEVVRGVANSGRQSLLIDGKRLSFFDGDYEGYYYPLFDYDPIAAGTPIVTISVDLLFRPTKKDAAAYAGIHVYDTAGNEFSGMHIDDEGRLYFGGSEYSDVSISEKRWHTLSMRLDFSARETQFYVDGQYLGVSPFGSDAGTSFSDADLLMESGDNPAPHKAYFDNYSIIASSDS